jgi:hypothetical protein
VILHESWRIVDDLVDLLGVRAPMGFMAHYSYFLSYLYTKLGQRSELLNPQV